MDPHAFMLAPLLMSDVEYQLWSRGIAYAQWLLGDLDYDEFNEDCLMSHFPIGLCTFSLPFFLSLYLAYPVCGDTKMW